MKPIVVEQFVRRHDSDNWRGKVAQQQAAKAAEVKAMDQKLFNKALGRDRDNVMPASEAEIVTVAGRLSARMNQLGAVLTGQGSSRSSYKLFRHLDSDGSGKIGWDEFLSMLRGELGVSTVEMPDARMRAVWLALDNDGSG